MINCMKTQRTRVIPSQIFRYYIRINNIDLRLSIQFHHSFQTIQIAFPHNVGKTDIVFFLAPDLQLTFLEPIA